jgi:hypothetical protein
VGSLVAVDYTPNEREAGGQSNSAIAEWVPNKLTNLWLSKIIRWNLVKNWRIVEIKKGKQRKLEFWLTGLVVAKSLRVAELQAIAHQDHGAVQRLWATNRVGGANRIRKETESRTDTRWGVPSIWSQNVGRIVFRGVLS